MTYFTIILEENSFDNYEIPFFKHRIDIYNKYENDFLGDKVKTSKKNNKFVNSDVVYTFLESILVNP